MFNFLKNCKTFSKLLCHFTFPPTLGLSLAWVTFLLMQKKSQLTSPCYNVRGKVENSSILNSSCETYPAWVLVTRLTLSQWWVKGTGSTGELQTSWPTLHWRKGRCPHKCICSIELKVRTPDTKNSGLSERHFHVCMCEGPFSWDLNSFYPAVLLLSPCFTEAQTFLWHLEQWLHDAGVLGKRLACFHTWFSFISFTREGELLPSVKTFLHSLSSTMGEDSLARLP